MVLVGGIAHAAYADYAAHDAHTLPALRTMCAASRISSKKVEMLLSISSPVPIRERSRSRTGMCA